MFLVAVLKDNIDTKETNIINWIYRLGPWMLETEKVIKVPATKNKSLYKTILCPVLIYEREILKPIN